MQIAATALGRAGALPLPLLRYLPPGAPHAAGGHPRRPRCAPLARGGRPPAPVGSPRARALCPCHNRLLLASLRFCMSTLEPARLMPQCPCCALPAARRAFAAPRSFSGGLALWGGRRAPLPPAPHSLPPLPPRRRRRLAPKPGSRPRGLRAWRRPTRTQTRFRLFLMSDAAQPLPGSFPFPPCTRLRSCRPSAISAQLPVQTPAFAPETALRGLGLTPGEPPAPRLASPGAEPSPRTPNRVGGAGPPSLALPGRPTVHHPPTPSPIPFRS